MLARDNFKKSIIDKLKARVAHRCSNPDCRVPTSAATSDDGVNNIGIAAHITAASPGGPRYNASFSANERKSIDNAIWLCANCSIEIDRDTKKYTVNLLQNWKDTAEKASRSELGQKLPSNQDTVDTVTSALTGLPKKFIANAISNVHRATEQTLQALDPRFTVRSEFVDGRTSFTFHPKESVSLLMYISGNSANDFNEQIKQSVEHGKEFSIDSTNVSLEGSDLLETLFSSQKGRISISPTKIQATQKLWLIQNETGIIELFDDISGNISCGSKSFTFNGFACGKLFNLNYQKTFDSNDNKLNLSFSLSFKQWENINLVSLPYQEKLHSLYYKMSEGWNIFTSLEVNGKEVFRSNAIKINNSDYITETSTFLHYINRCKIISEALSLNIPFKSTISFTGEEHQHLAEVARVFEGKEVFKKGDMENNATCALVIDNECQNLTFIKETKEPTSFEFIQKDNDEIKIFDSLVRLPKKIISLNPVLPKILNQKDNLKPGDTVNIELLPMDNFEYSIKYKI